MAFVDEVTLEMKAGNGGDGIVSWLHLKGKEYSGAAGGDGGNGGDVFVRGVQNLSKLIDYQNTPAINAENGGRGKSRSMHGRNGEPIFVDVPIGSFVTNTNTGETFNITEVGQEELVLKGGKGGWGNEHFKGSRNVSPTESTKGTKGEEGLFHIELRLIADFGLVGFPNAGKSSLLNALTRAKSKVADYKFTTLEPNLGNMYGYIIADIPGLIEGASVNKGLGHKFLRHIRRTKVVVHCIPADNIEYEKDYSIIRKELENYDKELGEKPEFIVITKTDTSNEEDVAKMKKFLMKKSKKVVEVSILDDESVKKLSESMIDFVRGLSK